MICKACTFPSFQEKPCPPSKVDLALLVSVVALTLLGVLTQVGVIQVPYLNCAAFTGAALGLAALGGKWIYQCVRGAKSQSTVPTPQVTSPTVATQPSSVSSNASAGSRDVIYTIDESKGNAWRAYQSGEKVGTQALHILREESFSIDNVSMTLFGIFPKHLLSNFDTCLEKIRKFQKFDRKEIHKLMKGVGGRATLVLHTGGGLFVSSSKFVSTKFGELTCNSLFSIEATKQDSHLLFATPEFWEAVSQEEYSPAFSKVIPSQIISELADLAKGKGLNEIQFLVIKDRF